MKKIVSLLLVLCMFMSAVPVLADKELNMDNMSDTTLIRMTVTEDLDTYTVIIPSVVDIDPSTQHG